MKSALTIKGKPIPSASLLRLPRELRDIIYALVLHEPIRCARRHGALCDWVGRKTTVPEPPPFYVDDEPDCRCSRRRNIGLLRTSRLIYNEASPIFWRQNTFSFTGAASFVEGISDTLGKTCRDFICHLRLDHETSRNVDEQTLLLMWDAIGSCKNLQTLEMNTRLLRPLANVLHLPRSHPHLERFRYFTLTRALGEIYDCAYKVWGNRLFFEHGQTVPPGLMQSIAESGWDTGVSLDALSNTFTERLRILVLGKRTCPKDYPRLRRGFNETKNKLAFPGNPDLEITATVYGLPICKATLAIHAKERQNRMKKWKAEGFPAKETTPPAVLVKAAKKKRDEELQHKQLKFELTMKEKGIKIRRHKPDPEPEDPRQTKRGEKLKHKWRTRVRQADRLAKTELCTLIGLYSTGRDEICGEW